jgi:hypothetical protein
MDIPPIRGGATNLSHVGQSNASETTTSEKGVKQEGGTRSRLASIRQSVLIAPTQVRQVNGLSYGGSDLRANAGTDKSWGRFKNMVAEKVPFVGSTSYGSIQNSADSFVALAPQATLVEKLEMLERLDGQIAGWQQKHADQALTVKGQAVADLGQAVAGALKDARDLEAAALKRFAPSVPASLPQPTQGRDVLTAQGPITGTAKERLARSMRDDVFTRDATKQPKNVDSGQGYPVSEVFRKDFIQRNDLLSMNVGRKTVYERNDGGDAAAELLKLAGGKPQVASSLSHYVGQHLLAGLTAAKQELLKAGDGSNNFIMEPGQPVFSYAITRNEPKARGGEPTFTIDYRIDHAIERMGKGGTHELGYATGSGIALAMQIEVSESELLAAKGTYTLTQPPGFALQLQADLDDLLKPTGGKKPKS